MDGTVVEFDEGRGLGTIDSDGATYPFHCTAIVDGSRTIDVGAPVTFEVRPAGMGRWEAAQIAPR
jgi:cold shock CspA family protein